MMKERKLLCALVIFALVAWAGSASAQHLLDTPLVCNTVDGVNFGVAGTASGAVKITSKGKLTLTMRGLPAGETAECELDCTQVPTSTHLAPCGTANASGRIRHTTGAFIDPARLCLGPRFKVAFASVPGECDLGWGIGPTGLKVPDRLTVGSPRPLSTHGGMGGSPVSARCPADTVVVGVRVFTDEVDLQISGVAVFCATPVLTSGSSGYGVAFTPITLGPYQSLFGTEPAGYLDGFCGGGAPAGGATAGYSGSSISGLAMYCAGVSVSAAADNTLSFSFTKTGTALGWAYGGGTFFQADCAANEALVGYNGNIGGYLYAIQPVCAPLVAIYK